MMWWIIAMIFIWWLFQDADFILLCYKIVGSRGGNLKGKVAWITGAGSGIGKSLAQHWAMLGVKLVLTDIDEESLTKFDDHLKKGGVSEGDILLLPGDITDVSHHDKWLKEILNKFGKLDILVNNAGRMSQGSLMMPMSAQKSQFEVNVFSHVALTQAVLPYFLEQKQGHIVAVSSLLALLPLSKLAPYSASKATILSYFTSLRAELWRHNIPVTVLCPGPVGTRLLARTPEPEEKACLQEKYPWFLNEMTSEKCAKLATIAVSNELHEVWITRHPLLFAVYVKQYLPVISDWLCMTFVEPFMEYWMRKTIHPKED